MIKVNRIIRISLIFFFVLVFFLFLDLKGWINIPFGGRISEWSIGIYEASDDPVLFHPAKNIANPVLTYRDVNDVSAEFVGDPFMIKKGNIWYMFFEVMNGDTRHADIGMAMSNDGLNWDYQQIVIDEPYNLSFPYVFEHEEETYILVQSATENSTRLYKAIDFPIKWTYIGFLVEGEYSDCALLYHNEIWWLFAGVGYDTLRLFYSEELLGKWIEHPMSPIVIKNPKYARPGGRIIHAGKKIYRYAQDDEEAYGKRIWAFEIKQLTTEDYQEVRYEVPVVEASGSGWNARRMHHIDPHRLADGRWIACVDGMKPGKFVFFRPIH